MSQMPNMPEVKRERLGYVWVDSGQLIVTDPCYLEELDGETIEQATTHRKREGLVMDGMAAAFRTGIRIGRYPVYVHKFENGAIARIEIELTENSAETEADSEDE